ncbi:hypothetical protein K7432_002038 [Basidiobolus ranarum]|uniref:Uncharacterized protein n=1 Tax=Basidiobolus ranarum TaxID=34480 RepID=A0ABR2W9B5_9FUNG
MMKSSCILLVCVLAVHVQAQEVAVPPATARATSIRSTPTALAQPNQSNQPNQPNRTVFVSATPANNPPRSTNRRKQQTIVEEDPEDDRKSESSSTTSTTSTSTSTSTETSTSSTPSLPASPGALAPSDGAASQVTSTLFIYAGLLVGYLLY